MIDFLFISTRSTKRGVVEIYPKFIIKKSADLMIRGGDFYAIWIEERGLWSTDEQDALQLIDYELDRYAKENSHKFDDNIRILHMWDAESGMIDTWHKYCQKQMRDRFTILDERLVFVNTPTNKKDYASKRLSYPLDAGDFSAYDSLMSILYDPEERQKIEWAIGSIVTGDSKKIQKFMVLYGAAGTGKSTVLNIIQLLFDGYYSVFDAKALGSSTNAFALEAFKSNPLVAIQHDGNLSRIEDNTRLNSLVSHEIMTVNEKFKSTYASRFKCFLFMGTNKPVRITDAKSGLIRRLIDVSPSGNKMAIKEYKKVVKQIEFELGAIAFHCREVYLSNPGMYDDYIPVTMLGASNDFYNFIIDAYYVFKKEDGTSMKAAWEMYKTYCDEAKVSYPFSQRVFKEELRNYFREYSDRIVFDDGTRARSYYSGFRTEKFETVGIKESEEMEDYRIDFKCTKSIFDEDCSNCMAQYATKKETPLKKWDRVTTRLSDVDTSKIHYVKVPENHIVIDFDMTDDDGNKSLDANILEASKWPRTYTEISKSGNGVHLHYIYTGDVKKLNPLYSEHIEVKVFTGNGALRRKLTMCNEEKIATISSGLPLKGEKKMVNFEAVKSEQGLRKMIERNFEKEFHPGTRPSVDFIHKILEDAYNSGLRYDVTDMRNAVLTFAANSTNQSEYCVKQVAKMKFKSDDPSEDLFDDKNNSPMVFFDVEVFPNLFIVCWKAAGDKKKVVRMINPKPSDVEELMRLKLVGFNCRRYDNHILYGAMLGYTNKQLYDLSQNIINGNRNCFFAEAYNVSYTDVFDFSSKKQSLKKFEIELGIHHQELGLPWDEQVPEELWPKVAEYCDNDVIATEAVFKARQSDFLARQILADIAGMTVNATTNTLTTRIIFGNDRKPQSQFNYRNLGDVSQIVDRSTITDDLTLFDGFGDEYTVFDKDGRPIFPGYVFEGGKSTYRGEEVGEGGCVRSEPGIYTDVALLDITSMHPNSTIAEELFGPVYTAKYKELVDARVAIKHEDWPTARKLMNGKLSKYIQKIIDGELTSKDLANALKIAINSVYGLTSAKFDNAFNDIRNKDNIVAKRGALFMINLKYEVQKRGFTVAHIKTDSIKIPEATPEIIQFVMDYGKQYGYVFEHEATYDRMCLVNDAVYIAKYKDGEHAGKWTATGTQFQVPYVFKSLFSNEDIVFDDLCETKSVTSSLYLDLNEGYPDVSEYEKELEHLKKMQKDCGIELDIIGHPLPGSEADELIKKISTGHNYRFIGKVGRFCPVKPGCGGGILLREKDGKYYAATGTKGYRWAEAELVQELGKEADIDRSYYDKMVNEAVKAIGKYGDFDCFISERPYDDGIPF